MQIKNPKATAIYMRIASVFGILLLLVLQILWFSNAYKTVDQEIMDKCKGCLKEAIDTEIFERFDSIPNKVYVNSNNNVDFLDYEIIASGQANKSDDFKIGINEFLLTLGSSVSLIRVDTLFVNNIGSKLTLIPKHEITLINDSVDLGALFVKGNADLKDKSQLINTSNDKNKDVKKVDNLLQFENVQNHVIKIRINSKQVVKLVVYSSLNNFFIKAKFLTVSSIIIVLMIGFIFISQLRTFLKERRFVQFIKEYTSSVTHDLQTPLNNIFLASELLSLGKFDNDIKMRYNYYKICKDQSERQIRNIKKILVLAKSEQSNITVEKHQIILKGFLEGISEYFRKGVLYSKDQIEINIQCNPENLRANIDADGIESVMNNLIDNAIKYSHEKVKIDINCYCEEENVFIKVKDNGIGIPVQNLKNIFENFNRSNQSERKRIFGYGIGLSFVEKIVEAHGGSVNVISSENEGSEFIISLPG